MHHNTTSSFGCVHTSQLRVLDRTRLRSHLLKEIETIKNYHNIYHNREVKVKLTDNDHISLC